MSGQNIEIVKLQVRRGLEADLPTLDSGEPAITIDTHKIFFGDGTNNHELAHKADLDTTNGQLADITSKVLYMSKYKRIAPETTDDGRFTRMLADLQDGCILFFEANATYTISSRKQFVENNIKVFGCGSTIEYTGTDATEILLIGNSSKISQAGKSITVTKNANTVTLTDVTNISVGDIFTGYNNVVGTNGYYDGIYGEVVSIDTTNKIVTLNINFHKSFTMTDYSVYTAVDGVTFQDLTINGNANMKNISFNFANVKNTSILNCGGDGRGGRVGINLQGINCEIKFCKFQNYYDTALVDNQTGYGISVAGHNINVEQNNIKKCKHILTSAARLLYSTGIHFNKNICFRDVANATTLPQLIDFHANAEGSITNNILYNVGGYGIGVRSNNVLVEGNVLYSLYSTYNGSASIKGIACLENCTSDITVRKNTLIGFFNSAFILETNQNVTFQNFNIVDNRIDFGGIYFNAYNGGDVSITDSAIANNQILKEGTVQFNNIAGSGVVIDKNVIYSSYYVFTINININKATSKPIGITNNRLYHGTAGGDNIRVQNDWNVITGNINTMSDTTTSPIHTYTANNIKANNVWIKSDGTIQSA